MTTRLQRGRIAPSQPKWKQVLAIWCVLLVAAIGTAQAVHVHGDWLPKVAKHASVPVGTAQGQGEEHCPLCVAMHSTLPVTMQAVPLPAAELTHRLTAHALVAPKRFRSFAMFSRPPPVASRTLAAAA